MFQRLSRLPWLPVILVAAFMVRAGAALAVQERVDRTGSLCLIAGDAEGYWMLARHLARGEDFAIYDPPRYVERMPGFPLVLAGGMKIFGEHALRLRLLLAAVGTAACYLVYRLGRDVIDETTGMLACLFAAISPTFIVFSVLLLSETAFAAALLASLIALVNVIRAAQAGPVAVRPGRQAIMATLAGILCGVATLIRPTWILVGPAFAVTFVMTWRNDRRRFVNAGLLLAGLVVCLAPWTGRNWRVTGHFVPTTLWMGPSLYDGLSPRATGDSNMQFVEADGFYAQRDVGDFEYQADRHYRRAAVDFAWRNPGRAVELGLYKLWRFVNPFPNAAQFNHWAVWWIVGLFETPVLLLAIYGAWKSRAACWTLALLAGPVLYFALVHTVFVGSVRYRLPAEYAFLVLTAFGACRLAERRVPATP